MASISKPTANGKIPKEDEVEFFRLYSEAMEESIRDDYEYWVEIQRKAPIS